MFGGGGGSRKETGEGDRMGLIFPAGAHNETAEHFRCSQHDSSFPHVVQTYINAQHRMLTR